MATPTRNSIGVTEVNFSGAMVDGYRWGGTTGTPVTLTYSFLQGTAWHITGYGEGEPSSWSPLSSAEQAVVRSALAAWSAVSGVTFVEVADNHSTVGELRFARTNIADPDSAAHAYTPSDGVEAGDVWFNNTNWHVNPLTNVTPGTHDYLTVLHEIGHALGLSHPFEGPVVFPDVYDTYSFTVMSYSPHAGNEDDTASFYPTTPMYFDLARIQAIYGRRSHNSENTTYTYAQGRNYWETIDDSGGIDTIRHNSAVGGIIDLQIGHWSQLGNVIVFGNGTTQRETVAIGPNTLIENAIGGSGNDLITGNSLANSLRGGNGNDTLNGLAGNDTLNGDAGADTLNGSSGNDRLYGGADNDTLIGGLGADVFSGSTGRDIVTYRTSSTAVNVDMLSRRSVGGESAGDIFSSIEDLSGGRFADRLGGNAAGNTIFGLAGNDYLSGADGEDILIGGAGADQLVGGAGYDTASYYSSTSRVSVDLATGIGRLGDAQGDRLSSIERLIGSPANDILYGHAIGNRISGGSGNDTILGRAGNDVLDGGGGRDTLNGEAGSDVLISNLEHDYLRGGTEADTFIFIHYDNYVTNHSLNPYMSDAGGAFILDFSSAQGDRINLSALDADFHAGGDQAFTFLGIATSSFSTPGSLWCENRGGTWYLFGIVDQWAMAGVGGDSQIDLRIALNTSVSASDLIL